MKIRIDIQDVHEEVEASDATGVLSRVKDEASKRAPWLLRGPIRAMNDLTFAGEAVKQHNNRHQSDDAKPASAQEFLDWAVKCGYVTILES